MASGKEKKWWQIQNLWGEAGRKRAKPKINPKTLVTYTNEIGGTNLTWTRKPMHVPWNLSLLKTSNPKGGG